MALVRSFLYFPPVAEADRSIRACGTAAAVQPSGLAAVLSFPLFSPPDLRSLDDNQNSTTRESSSCSETFHHGGGRFLFAVE